MKLSEEITDGLEEHYDFRLDMYKIPFDVIDQWIGKVKKMENDLIQIHTYTPCINKCGKSVRYSYSVGPGMCPDCAWKEIQESRQLVRQLKDQSLYNGFEENYEHGL